LISIKYNNKISSISPNYSNITPNKTHPIKNTMLIGLLSCKKETKTIIKINQNYPSKKLTHSNNLTTNIISINLAITITILIMAFK